MFGTMGWGADSSPKGVPGDTSAVKPMSRWSQVKLFSLFFCFFFALRTPCVSGWQKAEESLERVVPCIPRTIATRCCAVPTESVRLLVSTVVF